MESKVEEGVVGETATSGEIMEKEIKAEEFGDVGTAEIIEEADDDQLEKGQSSPLTGSYLLIVIAEPYSTEDRERIIQRLTNGLLSWDRDLSHVDLNCELLNLANSAPEGDEAKNGEKLVQWASENLVVEVLIHSQVNTLLQCMKNLLASFTRHRHIIHAGYTFSGSGSWLLQDGTFSLNDFLELWDEPEVTRLLAAYKGDISLSLHCANGSTSGGESGAWTTERFRKEPFSKLCQVDMNPSSNAKLSSAHNAGITCFVDYISKLILPSPLDEILQPSDIVGNIRFSHPTLYVFPGGHGDAALFGVNGFNMLIDGGFSRKACFWNFVRHLDRLDAVLLTRINHNSVGGLGALLDRKKMSQVFPQIGHFFSNLPPGTSTGKDKSKMEDNGVEKAEKEMKSKKEDGQVPPFINNDLMISLTEVGKRMMENLHGLNLKPQLCFRENHIDPINLYHKVGHGKLDLYVLNPAKDSRELKEFLMRWNNPSSSSKSSTLGQSKIIMKRADRNGREIVSFPVLNLVSICALVVWQPTNPNENITRLLFPGSTPQQKIFEALGKLKHLDFLKFPVCSANSIAASKIKPKVVKSEKIITEVKSQMSSKSSSSQILTSTTKTTTATAPSPKVSIPKAAKTGQNREKQLLVTGEKIDIGAANGTVTDEPKKETEASPHVNGIKEKEPLRDRPRRGRSETRRAPTRRVPSSSTDKQKEKEPNKVSKKSQLKTTEETVTATASSTTSKVSGISVKKIPRPASAAPAKKDVASDEKKAVPVPPSPKKTETAESSAPGEPTGAETDKPLEILSTASSKTSAPKRESKYGIAQSLSKASTASTTSSAPPKAAKEAVNKKTVQQKSSTVPPSKIAPPKSAKAEPKEKLEPKEKAKPSKKEPVKSTIPKATPKSTGSSAPKPVGRKPVAGIVAGGAIAGIVTAAAITSANTEKEQEEPKTNGTVKSPTPEQEENQIEGESTLLVEEKKQNGFSTASASEPESELSSLEHVSVAEEDVGGDVQEVEVEGEPPISLSPSPLDPSLKDVEGTPSSTHTMTDTDDNTPKAEQYSSQRYTDEEDEYLVVQKSITDDESADQETITKAADTTYNTAVPIAEVASNGHGILKEDDVEFGVTATTIEDEENVSQIETLQEVATQAKQPAAASALLPKDTIDTDIERIQPQQQVQQTQDEEEDDVEKDDFDMVEKVEKETAQPLFAGNESDNKQPLEDDKVLKDEVQQQIVEEVKAEPESIINRRDEGKLETTQPLKKDESELRKTVDEGQKDEGATITDADDKSTAKAPLSEPIVKEPLPTLGLSAEMETESQHETISEVMPAKPDEVVVSTIEMKKPSKSPEKRLDDSLEAGVESENDEDEAADEQFIHEETSGILITEKLTVVEPQVVQKEFGTSNASPSPELGKVEKPEETQVDLQKTESKVETEMQMLLKKDHERTSFEEEDFTTDDMKKATTKADSLMTASQDEKYEQKAGPDLADSSNLFGQMKEPESQDVYAFTAKTDEQKLGEVSILGLTSNKEERQQIKMEEAAEPKDVGEYDSGFTTQDEKTSAYETVEQKKTDDNFTNKLDSGKETETLAQPLDKELQLTEEGPKSPSPSPSEQAKKHDSKSPSPSLELPKEEEITKDVPKSISPSPAELIKEKHVEETIPKSPSTSPMPAEPVNEPLLKSSKSPSPSHELAKEKIAPESLSKSPTPSPEPRNEQQEKETSKSPSPSPTPAESTKDRVEVAEMLKSEETAKVEKGKSKEIETVGTFDIPKEKYTITKEEQIKTSDFEKKDEPFAKEEKIKTFESDSEKKDEPFSTTALKKDENEVAVTTTKTTETSVKQIEPEVLAKVTPAGRPTTAKREVIRTPDEVAELPVHEVVESEIYKEETSASSWLQRPHHDEEGYTSDEDHGVEVMPISKSPLITSGIEEKADLETAAEKEEDPKKESPVHKDEEPKKDKDEKVDERQAKVDKLPSIEKIDAAISSAFQPSLVVAVSSATETEDQQQKPEPVAPVEESYYESKIDSHIETQYSSSSNVEEQNDSFIQKDDSKTLGFTEKDEPALEPVVSSSSSGITIMEPPSTVTLPAVVTAKTSVVITPSTPPVIKDESIESYETKFKMPEPELPTQSGKDSQPQIINESVQSPKEIKELEAGFAKEPEVIGTVSSFTVTETEEITSSSKIDTHRSFSPIESTVTATTVACLETSPPVIGESKGERKVSSGDESSNSTASSTSMKTTVISQQQSPASENISNISQTPESVVCNQFGTEAPAPHSEVETKPAVREPTELQKTTAPLIEPTVPEVSKPAGSQSTEQLEGSNDDIIREKPQFYVGSTDKDGEYYLVETPSSEQETQIGVAARQASQQEVDDNDDDGVYELHDDDDEGELDLEGTPVGAVRSGLMCAATTASATVIRHSPEHWATSEAQVHEPVDESNQFEPQEHERSCPESIPDEPVFTKTEKEDKGFIGFSDKEVQQQKSTSGFGFEKEEVLSESSKPILEPDLNKSTSVASAPTVAELDSKSQSPTLLEKEIDRRSSDASSSSKGSSPIPPEKPESPDLLQKQQPQQNAGALASTKLEGQPDIKSESQVSSEYPQSQESSKVEGKEEESSFEEKGETNKSAEITTFTASVSTFGPTYTREEDNILADQYQIGEVRSASQSFSSPPATNKDDKEARFTTFTTKEEYSSSSPQTQPAAKAETIGVPASSTTKIDNELVSASQPSSESGFTATSSTITGTISIRSSSASTAEMAPGSEVIGTMKDSHKSFGRLDSDVSDNEEKRIQEEVVEKKESKRDNSENYYEKEAAKESEDDDEKEHDYDHSGSVLEKLAQAEYKAVTSKGNISSASFMDQPDLGSSSSPATTSTSTVEETTIVSSTSSSTAGPGTGTASYEPLSKEVVQGFTSKLISDAERQTQDVISKILAEERAGDDAWTKMETIEASDEEELHQVEQEQQKQKPITTVQESKAVETSADGKSQIETTITTTTIQHPPTLVETKVTYSGDEFQIPEFLASSGFSGFSTDKENQEKPDKTVEEKKTFVTSPDGKTQIETTITTTTIKHPTVIETKTFYSDDDFSVPGLQKHEEKEEIKGTEGGTTTSTTKTECVVVVDKPAGSPAQQQQLESTITTTSIKHPVETSSTKFSTMEQFDDGHVKGKAVRDESESSQAAKEETESFKTTSGKIGDSAFSSAELCKTSNAKDEASAFTASSMAKESVTDSGKTSVTKEETSMFTTSSDVKESATQSSTTTTGSSLFSAAPAELGRSSVQMKEDGSKLFETFATKEMTSEFGKSSAFRDEHGHMFEQSKVFSTNPFQQDLDKKIPSDVASSPAVTRRYSTQEDAKDLEEKQKLQRRHTTSTSPFGMEEEEASVEEYPQNLFAKMSGAPTSMPQSLYSSSHEYETMVVQDEPEHGAALHPQQQHSQMPFQPMTMYEQHQYFQQEMDEENSSGDFSDSQLSTVPQLHQQPPPSYHHVLEPHRPQIHPRQFESDEEEEEDDYDEGDGYDDPNIVTPTASNTNKTFGQPAQEIPKMDVENGNANNDVNNSNRLETTTSSSFTTTGITSSTTATTSSSTFGGTGGFSATTSTTTTTMRSQEQLRTPAPSSAAMASDDDDEDIIKKWGKPLGLPIVHPENGVDAPPSGAAGSTDTPKETSASGTATPAKSAPRQRSSSARGRVSHVTRNLPPIHVDLAYVPHHGNSNYSDSEFFRLIRSRYYVFSGLEPSRQVFEGLLRGKQAWEDKNLHVTIIPTYDTDNLAYWVIDSEEALHENHIDLAPSASRCTINLQDHDTSCAAYRLEF